MTEIYHYNRREFLKAGGLLVMAAGFFASKPVLAAQLAGTMPRRLKFHNLHTGENIDITYHNGRNYDPVALQKLDWFFRDHRQNEAMEIDRKLYDFLYDLKTELDTDAAFHLISGYRSQKTNDMLRNRGGVSSGVAQKSQHTLGRAADIRIPGVKLEKLRDTAIALQKGGVGYYSRSNFVHVDTGRVRRW